MYRSCSIVDCYVPNYFTDLRTDGVAFCLGLERKVFS